MRNELKEYDTSKVCELIGVSRSGYYKASKSSESEETEIEKAVIHCFKKHDRNYGRIRIRQELLVTGIHASESKISRIMKKHGLVAKSGRKGRARPLKSKEPRYIEENLIKDKFSVKMPNYLWCSDITELRYRGGKLYVCGIIDVATRRIVGWSIDRRQPQTLVQDAFHMAIGRNPSRPFGAVFHSDQGSQYTALRTKQLVETAGFRKSMSRPGTPSDNQPIESFWRTLEAEMPDIGHLSFEDASRVVVRFIELYYNSVRLHSSIGFSSPNAFFTLLSVH